MASSTMTLAGTIEVIATSCEITFNSSSFGAVAYLYGVAQQTKSQLTQSLGTGVVATDKQWVREQLGKQYDISSLVGGLSTVLFAVATPYKTLDGSWRLNFNISGSYAGDGLYLTIEGVVYKTTGASYQAVTAWTSGSTSSTRYALAQDGANSILFHSSSSGSGKYFSGDVALDGKPEFAVDYDV